MFGVARVVLHENCFVARAAMERQATPAFGRLTTVTKDRVRKRHLYKEKKENLFIRGCNTPVASIHYCDILSQTPQRQTPTDSAGRICNEEKRPESGSVASRDVGVRLKLLTRKV